MKIAPKYSSFINNHEGKLIMKPDVCAGSYIKDLRLKIVVSKIF